MKRKGKISQVKELIRTVVPIHLLDRIYLARMRARTRREFRLDLRRYSNAMNPEDRLLAHGMTKSAIETQATKDYHRVEKALTLAEVKRPFGQDLARRLDAIQPQIENHELAQHTLSARRALDEWNERGLVSDVVSPAGDARACNLAPEAVEDFFRSRRSIRHFSNRAVQRDLFERAVDLAEQSPSVCNRQAWRVHIADNAEQVRYLLTHQNGNRGFGQVPALAIITADARLFAGPGERNQAWIDSSLFAMTFVWALHGLAIGSCMLNMSVTNAASDRLRAAAGIPNHELIVMMIAIGYPADGHRVARSPRRGSTSILRYV